MTKGKQTVAKDRAITRNLLPLVALGSGLAAMPAAALELGDITVESRLGQPLRASIAYALGPNEMLNSTCVSVSGARSTGDLPAIGASSIRVTGGRILISGTSAVYEPMLGARVTVNCPYTPNLSREYLLFVDPAPVAEARRGTPPLLRPATVDEARPAARMPETAQAVGQSSNYQVRPGDTLSGIVRRIENRSMKLWPAVNAIFAANPDAFIDNDPNRIKTGAWLTIPSLDGSTPRVAPTVATTVAPTVAPTAAPEPVADTTPATAPLVEAVPVTAAAGDHTADLIPGVANFDIEQAEARATIVIPEVAAEAPRVTVETTPAVPTTVVSTGARSESTSLLVWLLGGALAVIASLALFGRRFRKDAAPTPPATAAAKPAVGEDAAVGYSADYDIEDDSPTEENLVLDADLELGTGFDDDADVVAADFGFAATTNLDIELPFEPQAPTDAGTDIIPPIHMDVESILESEVLPEDDDYDMSVIIDATKMPQPEEVTECDLMAVEVGTGDETTNNGYTISSEVDYDILEQDYEDELSATQALNEEIARAALEMPVANDDETAELKIESGTVDTKRIG